MNIIDKNINNYTEYLNIYDNVKTIDNINSNFTIINYLFSIAGVPR